MNKLNQSDAIRKYLIRPKTKEGKKNQKTEFNKEFSSLKYKEFLQLALHQIEEGVTVRKEQLTQLFLLLSDHKEDNCSDCSNCPGCEKGTITPFMVMKSENQGIRNCLLFLSTLLKKNQEKYFHKLTETLSEMKQIRYHYQKKEELFLILLDSDDQEQKSKDDQTLLLLEEIIKETVDFSSVNKQKITKLLSLAEELIAEENLTILPKIESKITTQQEDSISKRMPDYQYCFLAKSPKPSDYKINLKQN
ncbi:MAG: hypothetical protein WCR67_05065 [Bacilli bacterium]